MQDYNYCGFVYLWVNNHLEAVNHSKYIGQHLGNVDDGYTGSGTIFKRRFKSEKYKGFWTRLVLEYCDNADMLNKAEIYWIE